MSKKLRNFERIFFLKTEISTFEINNNIAPLAVTPNDPLFGNQWHLNGANGINVQNAWDDYTGDGIKIGFIDNGIQYTHLDLNDNYDGNIDYDVQYNNGDGAPKLTGDNHGTTTSGVAGAEGNNGAGVTGVAYDSTITSFRVNFGSNVTEAQWVNLFDRQKQVDISNNSWGFTGFFSDNFKLTSFDGVGAKLQDVANTGRGGLGTNIVFAAGNSRETGDNVNYHNMQNSIYTVAVAATDAAGKYTYFSTPGAAVLVSAPGLNITSTDRTGSAGYVNGDYVGGLAGTSYSAPIVSGVIALMLDANPNLGYRDIQEILAYSSRNSDAAHTRWQINDANNWNGGGLHFSNDYGFGLVNALAAVRLAETWGTQSTVANMDMSDSGVQTVNTTITDNNATGITRTFNLSSNIVIDKVTLDINITHGWIGDLKVVLISPSGTESVLVNRPGINPDNPSGYGTSQDNINFTLSSNAFWGEDANGTWTLKVIDADSGYVGTLQNWQLKVYGDTDDNNDVYIYTDEFSNYANSSRTNLTDTSGTDAINASAVTSNSNISLIAGATSVIDGVNLTIANSTVIENLFTGDGNDTILGNDIANVIDAGRGNDDVQGNGENDNLKGGLGTDIARYIGAFTDYVINIINTVSLTIQDIFSGNGDEGTDTVTNFEKIIFDDEVYIFNGYSLTLEGEAPPPIPNNNPDAVNDTSSTNQNQAKIINVLSNDSDSDGNSILVSDITVAAAHGTTTINLDNTITYTPEADWFGVDEFTYEINDGLGGIDTATVTVTVNEVVDPNQTINGTNNADTLNGGSGNDTIDGKRGNDIIDGKSGNDTIQGGYGNDTIYGGKGNDTIRGGYDNDILFGGDGDDNIYSERGNDTFYGGKGADHVYANSGIDIFVFENMADAGDIISSFKKNQDKLDLRPLFDSIGYAGANPVADGFMSFSYASGDLKILIDQDGAGNAYTPVQLLMLDNLNSNSLTLGVDYLVQ